jgi:phosphoglycolate phosphatase
MISVQEHLSDKTHVIWDWNGTLLDDVDLCVEIINGLLKEHDLPEINRDSYRAKFRFPIIEYYRDLGFDYQKFPFEKLAVTFIERYETRVVNCALFEGAKDLLSSISAQNKAQSILSAAHESGLLQLTRHHGIDHQFAHICGLSDHYAASKVERGKALISQIALPAKQILLVGDTDHDLEVGRALGIEVLLLGDGHQHPSRYCDHPKVLHSRY